MYANPWSPSAGDALHVARLMDVVPPAATNASWRDATEGLIWIQSHCTLGAMCAADSVANKPRRRTQKKRLIQPLSRSGATPEGKQFHKVASISHVTA